jgi:hypothetical protein
MYVCVCLCVRRFIFINVQRTRELQLKRFSISCLKQSSLCSIVDFESSNTSRVDANVLPGHDHLNADVVWYTDLRKWQSKPTWKGLDQRDSEARRTDFGTDDAFVRVMWDCEKTPRGRGKRKYIVTYILFLQRVADSHGNCSVAKCYHKWTTILKTASISSKTWEHWELQRLGSCCRWSRAMYTIRNAFGKLSRALRGEMTEA